MNEACGDDIACARGHARSATSGTDRQPGTLIQEKTMLSADYRFLGAITAAESDEFDQHDLA
jgi:hypothetical protein